MGEIVKNKFANIIENNSGLQTMNITRDILIVKNQQVSLDFKFNSKNELRLYQS